MASAAAIAWATVKLTVTLTLIAAVRRLLDRPDARARGRQLHDDVGRDAGELDGLLDHRVRRPEQHRVGLDREPALPPGLGLEHGLEQPRPGRSDMSSTTAHARSVTLASGRSRASSATRRRQRARILVPDVDHDGRVRRRAHRTVAERVLQLVDRARVVPDVGGRAAQRSGRADCRRGAARRCRSLRSSHSSSMLRQGG